MRDGGGWGWVIGLLHVDFQASEIQLRQEVRQDGHVVLGSVSIQVAGHWDTG